MTLLGLLLFACSSGSGGDTAASTVDTSPPACASDPRIDSYAPDLIHDGDSGIYTFTLVSSDPAPPVQGTNDWTISLADSAGAVTDATLTAVPFMPDMGHGTSATPVTTRNGDDYDISPVYLFMSGVWNVTLTAEEGDVSDQAVFTFCVG